MNNTKIIISTWIYAALLSPLFFLASLVIDSELHAKYLLGFLLGTVISLFAFSLIIKTVKKTIQKGKNEKVVGPYMFAYFIRILLYTIVLYVTYQSDTISWITTVFGYFSVKIVIILLTLFSKNNI